MNVGEYLDAWLDHVRGRVRVRTWEGYECLIRVNAKPELGERALSELHALDLQRLYGSLLKKGLGGGTVLNLHLVLTQALAQAVRWGYLAANPAAGAQPPRPRRKELVVLDHAATAVILGAAAGTRMEAPVGLAIATGMRRGEILGLRWSDLDADFTVAHVARTLQATKQGMIFERPKTPRSRRNVVLPEFCVPYFRRQKADQDRRKELAGDSWNEGGIVIDYRNGEPWNPWSFAPAWSAFLRKAGLPHVRFQSTRALDSADSGEDTRMQGGRACKTAARRDY